MHFVRLSAFGVAFVWLAVACGSSSSPSGVSPDGSDGSDASTSNADSGTSLQAEGGTTVTEGGSPANADGGILAARPYTLHVPTGYDKTKATPLVIMFHGYSATGAGQEAYFEITATADKNTFLYAYGDGTKDQLGNEFWNATDACCDLYHTGVDDVAYFDAITADVVQKYNVDPKRVFVIGHSNGGFMSHRLACDRTSTVAAIVSLSGAQWNDPTKCSPSGNISVAEVHGDADPTISYTGGEIDSVMYPAAATTVATWAAKNGCTGAIAETGTTYDLDSVLIGNETAVQAYAGCPAGIDVQLWTIHNGGHIPNLTHPGWGDTVWSFLAAHPKP